MDCNAVIAGYRYVGTRVLPDLKELDRKVALLSFLNAVAVTAIIDGLIEPEPLVDTVMHVCSCIYMALLIDGRISCFFWGIGLSTSHAIMAYQNELYSQFSMQILFLLIQPFGVVGWHKTIQDTDHRPEHKPIQFSVAFTSLCFPVLISVALRLALDINHVVWLDIAFTGTSVAAQILTLQHRSEMFVGWILANSLAIALFVLTEQWKVVAVMGGFLVFSIHGLYQWVTYKAPETPTPTITSQTTQIDMVNNPTVTQNETT